MTRARLSPEARTFLRTVGDVLRGLRKEAGIGQEQLAARAGMAPGRIGEIERATGDPALSRLWALARSLGLAPSGILRRVELAGADGRTLDETRARVVEGVRRLSAVDLDLVGAIVRRLL